MVKDRTVLITGAARGIGYSIAEIFAEAGNGLYIVDKDENVLFEAKKKLKDAGAKSVVAFPIDLRKSTFIKSMFDEIKTVPAEIVVNCAGISAAGLMKDVDEKAWDRVLDVNTKAVFLVSKFAANQMIDSSVENGRIINISSQASKIGERANGIYSVSKAAVNMITQVMGLELAEYGITVNAICPGYVRSEMLVQVFNERGPLEGVTPAEYERLLTSKVPLGRLATPKDIAKFAFFLAGDDASYATGVSYTVAGGVTLI